jgi:hypothetical protein
MILGHGIIVLVLIKEIRIEHVKYAVIHILLQVQQILQQEAYFAAVCSS